MGVTTMSFALEKQVKILWRKKKSESKTSRRNRNRQLLTSADPVRSREQPRSLTPAEKFDETDIFLKVQSKINWFRKDITNLTFFIGAAPDGSIL